MRGITFGELHTYDDLGLILSSKEIGSPTVKKRQIDVEGADGALDLTGYFGEPKYENVTHKFDFTAIGSHLAQLALFSRAKAALHGQKMRIVLDDDPAYYWWGRCYVSSYTSSRGVGTLSVECECDPYKYKTRQTVVTQAVSGSATLTLTNGRKRAVPTITATAAFTLGFGGGSYSRVAGTYTIPEIQFVEGNNMVQVTGTGTITFRWQEGNL